jgi:hypothetical protein
MGGAVTPSFLDGARYGMVSASGICATDVTRQRKPPMSASVPKIELSDNRDEVCVGGREELSARTMMNARYRPRLSKWSRPYDR